MTRIIGPVNKGQRLHRATHISEFRASPDGVEGRFQARVLNYNVLDDYDTMFAPGVFTDSMKVRMPRIVWGHDWRMILGRWIDYQDTKDSLILTGEFDDFDKVPMAAQAYEQLRSGTIDQFSVGFRASEWVDSKMEDKEWMVRTFTKGLLDEVSLVLVGAVPDTELMAGSLRTAGLKLNVRDPLMSKEAAGAILLKLHLGEVDLADALAEIKAAPEQKVDPAPKAADADPDAPATDTPVQTPDAAEGQGTPDPAVPAVDPDAPVEPTAEELAAAEQAELDALEAELEDALALADR